MLDQLINKDVTIQMGTISGFTDRIKGRVTEVEKGWIKLEASKQSEYINLKSIGRIVIKKSVRNLIMGNKKALAFQIGTALFFAAAIIWTSVLLEGNEYISTITTLFIALWFIPFGLIEAARKTNKKLKEQNNGTN